MQIKHIEAEDMKKEMNEVQMRKYAEYDDIRSSVSFFYMSIGSNISPLFWRTFKFWSQWIKLEPFEMTFGLQNELS